MLEHFKKCVLEKKQCSVVYLGGSITEGQGAADKRLCWQGLLQSKIEQVWQQCEFTAVNAGIGGTDSQFGAIRMERDVLPYKPDLLFVEFAVNDYMRKSESIRQSLEAILYKLWSWNTDADVVFVLTTTMKMAEENYDIGRVPESVQVHMEVAERYGIPFINVGKVLLEKLQLTGKNAKELLPDLVHPNNKGYHVYFEALSGLLEELEREMENAEYKEDISSVRKEVPVNPYAVSRMVPARNAVLQGFIVEHIAMSGRFGSYVSSHTKGDFLEFTFLGDKIGLFYMISCDGGWMEWSLDGGEWNRLPSWDTYTLSFDRGSAKMLAEGLDFCNHTLKIRVSDKVEESLGNFVRIGDFLA